MISRRASSITQFPRPRPPIALLALQGAVEPHAARLEGLGHRVRLARSAGELVGAAGLVLPGGESTAQQRLIEAEAGLLEAIEELVRDAPVLATCAGLVLAAQRGWLDVDVTRNGWGRQICSAEAVGDAGLPLVLIRAPRITRVGNDVEVLETLRSEPVLVRSGRFVGATFHPELTDDARVHALAFGEAQSPSSSSSSSSSSPPSSASRGSMRLTDRISASHASRQRSKLCAGCPPATDEQLP